MDFGIMETGCPCGKEHKAAVREICVGRGILNRLPELVAKYGCKKPFLLADCNTWEAAGAQVAEILEKAEIPFSRYVFPDAALEPDEHAVGGAVMHFDRSCDLVIAVGSGVINDIGKILSWVSGSLYFIVGTAPSMDGYASATSSMSRDGLKISLNSRCADVIIGDTDILKNAPLHMLRSGIGDMLAKYVSIAEWRIAHLITGEYYCEEVASLIRRAVKTCVDHADGLMRREEAAVQAVFEGLVIGGLAMAYAGVSRPASGVEHYFSHVWDMRGLEFGLPVETHGIQCAVGTLLSVRLYEKVRELTPDREKAEAYVQNFSYGEWAEELRKFFGKAAEAMIALEGKEGKYRVDRHGPRFDEICGHWQQILEILQQELPAAEELEALLNKLEIPTEASALGVDTQTLRQSFRATKDIRDKYVLSRLCWDLGVLEDMCQSL